MRTLILSDLHLGGVWHTDLLRRADVRAPLLRAVEGVDRVVLLGDVLELRHGPPREALAVAKPFFEDLGRALAGRELIVVAGNHDHATIEPWLVRRSEHELSEPLGVEQLLSAEETSPMLVRLAEWAAPARVYSAYPGLWVRPDVYAMHGHYLDCHLTVPTIERLSVGVMSRLVRRPAQTFDKVDDYEAVTAPMYSWRHALARDNRTGNAVNGIGTVNAWRALGGVDQDDTHGGGAMAHRRASLARRLRMRALVAGFPVAVSTLNRLGLGPLRTDISSDALRTAGLRAMREVTDRLKLGDAHVVFGHTHRAGPLPGDDEREWLPDPIALLGASGAKLMNTGCWTYDSVFLSSEPGQSPYWPGSCVLVEDSGPPLLTRLLLDRTHEELRPSRA